MNDLFVGYIESQVHKDWERVFNQRRVRSSEQSGIDLPAAIRTVFATLKQGFSPPAEQFTACQLSPAECFSAL